MAYSELTVCDGFAFAHIAAYEERSRLARKRKLAFAAIDRRNGGSR